MLPPSPPPSFRERLFAWLHSDAMKMLATVPGPRPSFPLGNLMALAREELHVLMSRWHAAYGDVFVFWAFGKPSLLVNEPRLLEQILVHRRDDYFKDIPRAATAPIMGESVFRAPGGAEAVEKRRHHPFESLDLGTWYDRLLLLVDPLLDVTVAEWAPAPGEDPSEEVDLFDLMMHACFQLFGRVVLGTALTRRQYQDYLCMLREIGKRGSMPVSVSLNPMFWLRRWRWFSLVAERLRDGGTPHAARFDIAWRMRKANLPARYVRDEVSNIFYAGMRNVAIAVTMTVYLLGRHPEVARRLQEEIDGATSRGPPDLAALRRLAYLDRVLKESMRLYSVVPGFVREVKKDRSVVLGKVTLPPNAQIFIAPWTLHRNPRLWPDPLRFDPDRFLAEVPPAHYMPFGHGPRSCVGADFAVTTSKGLLVSLLSRYAVSVRPDLEVDVAMGSGTAYPRNGLPVRLSDRRGSRSPRAASPGSRQTPSSP